VFDNLGWWEILLLLLIAVFIFGPDKLPQAISDGLRLLRRLREMARGATSELSRELGTNIELEDLNPKAFIRKHVFSEEDEQALRRPLNDLVTGIRSDINATKSDLTAVAGGVRNEINGAKQDVRDAARGAIPTVNGAKPAIEPAAEPVASRFDDVT
jgi:sec-independent protein translocase protein TatB